jgi:hypothetical protein
MKPQSALPPAEAVSLANKKALATSGPALFYLDLPWFLYQIRHKSDFTDVDI